MASRGSNLAIFGVVTFAEFARHGDLEGGAISNGSVPTFTYRDCAVTREDEDAFLISTYQGVIRFERGDLLANRVDGSIVVYRPDLPVDVPGAASIVTRTPSSPILGYFDFARLLPHLRHVGRATHYFARFIDAVIADGPEKSAGLRKLLEALDCFLRADRA